MSVFHFISSLENFISLSQQIQCATPKDRGNGVRGKISSQVHYLNVTIIHPVYIFWTKLETADATFQATEKDNVYTITFICKNTLGETLTSTFTIGR